MGTNLRGTDLKGSNLRDANLDFSCLPLWCGGFNFKIDERLAKQLVYHIINLMQYSDLEVDKIFKKEVYNWLKDSHLISKHGMSILEHKELENE